MVLVWFWHGFGMVFVWFWYVFGMVLLWVWYGFGMVLVLVLVWFWHGFGMVLAWFWYGFCMVLVCFRYGFAVGLVWVWYGFGIGFGMVLAWFWCGFGMVLDVFRMVLVWFRHGFGMVLVWVWYRYMLSPRSYFGSKLAKMATFDRVLGPSQGLVLDGSSSPASTVAASPGELPTELESCTTTEPEIVEVSSPSSEVEIVTVREVPKLPTPEEEEKLMKVNERIGYLYRIQDRDAVWNRKITALREFFANETPEAKRARKARFRREVYGMHS